MEYDDVLHFEMLDDSSEMSSEVMSDDETAENETAENETAENETAENETAENETAENETAENETEDDETEDDEIAGLWRDINATVKGSEYEKSDFKRRVSRTLETLKPKIKELMQIGGTPGLAISVMRLNCKSAVCQKFGFRDVEKKRRMNHRTIFPIGSLTKTVTSAAMGICVDRNRVSWYTRVKDAAALLLGVKKDAIATEMTIAELLSDAEPDMSWVENVFLDAENKDDFPFVKTEFMSYLESQARLLPFGCHSAHSKLAYELAGQIIEAASGQPYSQFVHSRIFAPLSMRRTFVLTPPRNTKNVAKCYHALENGAEAPMPCPCPEPTDFLFGGPSVGIHSCLEDLMRLNRALIAGYLDQSFFGRTSTVGIPLRQMATVMSAHTAMDDRPILKASYGLGWAQVEIPGRMGKLGINPDSMPGGMPVLNGAHIAPRVIFSQGSHAGALCWNMILPETAFAITVMSNSLSLNDVPDWVGQLVFEALHVDPGAAPNDFIAAAKSSAKTNLMLYPELTRQRRRARNKSCAGTYWDIERRYKIVVYAEKDGDELCWSPLGQLQNMHESLWNFRGSPTQHFPLRHRQDDTFTWLPQTVEELSSRGLWVAPYQGPGFWKIRFHVGDDKRDTHLFWARDKGAPLIKWTKVPGSDNW